MGVVILSQEFQAVHDWHMDIEKDDIIGLLFGVLQPLLAVICRSDIMLDGSQYETIGFL
jgi:hypothetical protein